MKTKKLPGPRPDRAAIEGEIRDYAYHLYQESGCIPGRDLDNWQEAEACLGACAPKAHPLEAANRPSRIEAPADSTGRADRGTTHLAA